jgi:hypothetical protein
MFARPAERRDDAGNGDPVELLESRGEAGPHDRMVFHDQDAMVRHVASLTGRGRLRNNNEKGPQKGGLFGSAEVSA